MIEYIKTHKNLVKQLDKLTEDRNKVIEEKESLIQKQHTLRGNQKFILSTEQLIQHEKKYNDVCSRVEQLQTIVENMDSNILETVGQELESLLINDRGRRKLFAKEQKELSIEVAKAINNLWQTIDALKDNARSYESFEYDVLNSLKRIGIHPSHSIAYSTSPTLIPLIEHTPKSIHNPRITNKYINVEKLRNGERQIFDSSR